MTDDFNPDRYHDDYQEQLHELIQAKLEGGEAFTTEEQPKELDETEDVSDLLAKLEASVKARRDGGGGGSDEAGQEGGREEGAGEEDRGQEDTRQERPAKKAAAKK